VKEKAPESACLQFCVCAYVCACLLCVHARAMCVSVCCVRACVCTCMHACVCVCMHACARVLVVGVVGYVACVCVRV